MRRAIVQAKWFPYYRNLLSVLFSPRVVGGKLTMGLTRKDALKRLEGLLPVVQKHVQKVLNSTTHQHVAHWRAELKNWLDEMDRVAHYTGKRTAAEWRTLIQDCREQAGVDS